MTPDVRCDAQPLLMVPERAPERTLALPDRPPASGSDAKEDDDVSGKAPPGNVSTDEAPSDEATPGGISRFFLVTSQICSKIGPIPGSPFTLSALVCSAGMLTLKSRIAV